MYRLACTQKSYYNYSAGFRFLFVHKPRKSAVMNFSVTPSSRPTLSKFSKSYIPLVLESTCKRCPSGRVLLANLLQRVYDAFLTAHKYSTFSELECSDA